MAKTDSVNSSNFALNLVVTTQSAIDVKKITDDINQVRKLIQSLNTDTKSIEDKVKSYREAIDGIKNVQKQIRSQDSKIAASIVSAIQAQIQDLKSNYSSTTSSISPIPGIDFSSLDKAISDLNNTIKGKSTNISNMNVVPSTITDPGTVKPEVYNRGVLASRNFYSNRDLAISHSNDNMAGSYSAIGGIKINSAFKNTKAGIAVAAHESYESAILESFKKTTKNLDEGKKKFAVAFKEIFADLAMVIGTSGKGFKSQLSNLISAHVGSLITDHKTAVEVQKVFYNLIEKQSRLRGSLFNVNDLGKEVKAASNKIIDVIAKNKEHKEIANNLAPNLIRNLGGVYTQRETDFAKAYYTKVLGEIGSAKALEGPEKVIYHVYGETGLEKYREGQKSNKKNGIEELVKWANDSTGKEKKTSFETKSDEERKDHIRAVENLFQTYEKLIDFKEYILPKQKGGISESLSRASGDLRNTVSKGSGTSINLSWVQEAVGKKADKDLEVIQRTAALDAIIEGKDDISSLSPKNISALLKIFNKKDNGQSTVRALDPRNFGLLAAYEQGPEQLAKNFIMSPDYWKQDSFANKSLIDIYNISELRAMSNRAYENVKNYQESFLNLYGQKKNVLKELKTPGLNDKIVSENLRSYMQNVFMDIPLKGKKDKYKYIEDKLIDENSATSKFFRSFGAMLGREYTRTPEDLFKEQKANSESSFYSKVISTLTSLVIGFTKLYSIIEKISNSLNTSNNTKSLNEKLENNLASAQGNLTSKLVKPKFRNSDPTTDFKGYALTNTPFDKNASYTFFTEGKTPSSTQAGHVLGGNPGHITPVSYKIDRENIRNLDVRNIKEFEEIKKEVFRAINELRVNIDEGKQGVIRIITENKKGNRVSNQSVVFWGTRKNDSNISNEIGSKGKPVEYTGMARFAENFFENLKSQNTGFKELYNVNLKNMASGEYNYATNIARYRGIPTTGTRLHEFSHANNQPFSSKDPLGEFAADITKLSVGEDSNYSNTLNSFRDRIKMSEKPFENIRKIIFGLISNTDVLEKVLEDIAGNMKVAYKKPNVAGVATAFQHVIANMKMMTRNEGNKVAFDEMQKDILGKVYESNLGGEKARLQRMSKFNNIVVALEDSGKFDTSSEEGIKSLERTALRIATMSDKSVRNTLNVEKSGKSYDDMTGLPSIKGYFDELEKNEKSRKRDITGYAFADNAFSSEYLMPQFMIMQRYQEAMRIRETGKINKGSSFSDRSEANEFLDMLSRAGSVAHKIPVYKGDYIERDEETGEILNQKIPGAYTRFYTTRTTLDKDYLQKGINDTDDFSYFRRLLSALMTYKPSKEKMAELNSKNRIGAYAGLDPNLAVFKEIANKAKFKIEKGDDIAKVMLDAFTGKITPDMVRRLTEVMQKTLSVEIKRTGPQSVLSTASADDIRKNKKEAKKEQVIRIKEDIESRAPHKISGQIGNIVQKVAMYGGVTTLFYGMIHAITGAVETMKKFETQVVETTKVLNPIYEGTTRITESARAFGKEYGTSITHAAAAMSVFAQQGKSVAETINLTEASLLAANTTTLKATEATEALTVAIRQFGISDKNAVSIIDSWLEVESRTAVTAKVLADTLKQSGVAARNAGISFNEMNGMISAVGSATRESGSALGTAFKYIISHTRTEDAVENFQKLGIAVYDSNGRFRDFMDIMGELHSKWEDMTEEQRTSTAITIAGARRYNSLMILMDKWSDVIDASRMSEDSYGRAIAMNEKVMGTYAKRVEQTKAAMEGFYSKAFDSGAKGLLNYFENLKTAIASIGSVMPNWLLGSVGVGGLLGVGMMGISRSISFSGLGALWERRGDERRYNNYSKSYFSKELAPIYSGSGIIGSGRNQLTQALMQSFGGTGSGFMNKLFGTKPSREALREAFRNVSGYRTTLVDDPTRPGHKIEGFVEGSSGDKYAQAMRKRGMSEEMILSTAKSMRAEGLRQLVLMRQQSSILGRVNNSFRAFGNLVENNTIAFATLGVALSSVSNLSTFSDKYSKTGKSNTGMTIEAAGNTIFSAALIAPALAKMLSGFKGGGIIGAISGVILAALPNVISKYSSFKENITGSARISAMKVREESERIKSLDSAVKTYTKLREIQNKGEILSNDQEGQLREARNVIMMSDPGSVKMNRRTGKLELRDDYFTSYSNQNMQKRFGLETESAYYQMFGSMGGYKGKNIQGNLEKELKVVDEKIAALAEEYRNTDSTDRMTSIREEMKKLYEKKDEIEKTQEESLRGYFKLWDSLNSNIKTYQRENGQGDYPFLSGDPKMREMYYGFVRQLGGNSREANRRLFIENVASLFQGRSYTLHKDAIEYAQMNAKMIFLVRTSKGKNGNVSYALVERNLITGEDKVLKEFEAESGTTSYQVIAKAIEGTNIRATQVAAPDNVSTDLFSLPLKALNRLVKNLKKISSNINDSIEKKIEESNIYLSEFYSSFGSNKSAIGKLTSFNQAIKNRESSNIIGNNIDEFWERLEEINQDKNQSRKAVSRNALMGELYASGNSNSIRGASLSVATTFSGMRDKFDALDTIRMMISNASVTTKEEDVNALQEGRNTALANQFKQIEALLKESGIEITVDEIREAFKGVGTFKEKLTNVQKLVESIVASATSKDMRGVVETFTKLSQTVLGFHAKLGDRNETIRNAIKERTSQLVAFSGMDYMYARSRATEEYSGQYSSDQLDKELEALQQEAKKLRDATIKPLEKDISSKTAEIKELRFRLLATFNKKERETLESRIKNLEQSINTSTVTLGQTKAEHDKLRALISRAEVSRISKSIYGDLGTEISQSLEDAKMNLKFQSARIMPGIPGTIASSELKLYRRNNREISYYRDLLNENSLKALERSNFSDSDKQRFSDMRVLSEEVKKAQERFKEDKYTNESDKERDVEILALGDMLLPINEKLQEAIESNKYGLLNIEAAIKQFEANYKGNIVKSALFGAMGDRRTASSQKAVSANLNQVGTTIKDEIVKTFSTMTSEQKMTALSISKKISDLENAMDKETDLGYRKSYIFASNQERAVADMIQARVKSGESVEDIFQDEGMRNYAQSHPLVQQMVDKLLQSSFNERLYELQKTSSQQLIYGLKEIISISQSSGRNVDHLVKILSTLVGGGKILGQEGKPIKGWASGFSGKTGAGGKFQSAGIFEVHRGEGLGVINAEAMARNPRLAQEILSLIAGMNNGSISGFASGTSSLPSSKAVLRSGNSSGNGIPVYVIGAKPSLVKQLSSTEAQETVLKKIWGNSSLKNTEFYNSFGGDTDLKTGKIKVGKKGIIQTYSHERAHSYDVKRGLITGKKGDIFNTELKASLAEASTTGKSVYSETLAKKARELIKNGSNNPRRVFRELEKELTKNKGFRTQVYNELEKSLEYVYKDDGTNPNRLKGDPSRRYKRTDKIDFVTNKSFNEIRKAERKYKFDALRTSGWNVSGGNIVGGAILAASSLPKIFSGQADMGDYLNASFGSGMVGSGVFNLTASDALKSKIASIGEKSASKIFGKRLYSFGQKGLGKLGSSLIGKAFSKFIGPIFMAEIADIALKGAGYGMMALGDKGSVPGQKGSSMYELGSSFVSSVDMVTSLPLDIFTGWKDQRDNYKKLGDLGFKGSLQLPGAFDSTTIDVLRESAKSLDSMKAKYEAYKNKKSNKVEGSVDQEITKLLEPEKYKELEKKAKESNYGNLGPEKTAVEIKRLENLFEAYNKSAQNYGLSYFGMGSSSAKESSKKATEIAKRIAMLKGLSKPKDDFEKFAGKEYTDREIDEIIAKKGFREDEISRYTKRNMTKKQAVYMLLRGNKEEALYGKRAKARDIIKKLDSQKGLTGIKEEVRRAQLASAKLVYDKYDKEIQQIPLSKHTYDYLEGNKIRLGTYEKKLKELDSERKQILSPENAGKYKPEELIKKIFTIDKAKEYYKEKKGELVDKTKIISDLISKSDYNFSELPLDKQIELVNKGYVEQQAGKNKKRLVSGSANTKETKSSLKRDEQVNRAKQFFLVGSYSDGHGDEGIDTQKISKDKFNQYKNSGLYLTWEQDGKSYVGRERAYDLMPGFKQLVSADGEPVDTGEERKKKEKTASKDVAPKMESVVEDSNKKIAESFYKFLAPTNSAVGASQLSSDNEEVKKVSVVNWKNNILPEDLQTIILPIINLLDSLNKKPVAVVNNTPLKEGQPVKDSGSGTGS